MFSLNILVQLAQASAPELCVRAVKASANGPKQCFNVF